MWPQGDFAIPSTPWDGAEQATGHRPPVSEMTRKEKECSENVLVRVGPDTDTFGFCFRF